MGWGGRWEGGSGQGTHVHPWLIHVNVWQNPQYCKVISLQLKLKKFFKKRGKKKKKFKIFLLLAPFRGSSLPKHPGLMPPGIALGLPGALLGQRFSAFLVPQLSQFEIYILSFILAWDLQWSFRLATLIDFRCPQEFLPSALLIPRRGRRDLTQMPSVVRLYFGSHPLYPHSGLESIVLPSSPEI